MLPSHKEGVLYLEHCRIVANDGRLSFVREADAVEKFWSIPYAATGCILLGPGTSLTHQAAKFLSNEGVMTGFVGGGGAPLYFASQNEYRPTQFLQDWCSFWFDADCRLSVAKFLMECRVDFVRRCHKKLPIETNGVEAAASCFLEAIPKAPRPEVP